MFNMSMLAVLLDAKQCWWMQVLKISTGFDYQTIKFDTISIFNFQDEISIPILFLFTVILNIQY